MTTSSTGTTGLTGSSYIGSLQSSGLSGSTSASDTSLSLTTQDFLQLMTAQLNNQDPLNPQSNADFFGQMAQMSTVSGIGNLNSSFSSLASQLSSSQSLQAASLVGQYVMVPGTQAPLDSTGLNAQVEVPSSGDVTVQIKNSSGAVVKNIDLGTQSAGNVQFTWDGKDNSGTALNQGLYTISAAVSTGSGSVAASTDVVAKVLSVSLDSSGLTLDLNGLGATSFGDVTQIF